MPLLCGMCNQLPFPVAVLSEAWVCRRSIAGIAGSNSAGSVDVCLLCLLCVVLVEFLRLADHLSRRVLSSVCASLCVI